MMDFFKIREKEATRKGVLEVWPDYSMVRSKDLMVRGKSFYAIWDEAAGMWSRDEYDVPRLIDQELAAYEVQTPGIFDVVKKYLSNFSSSAIVTFHNYMLHLSDSSHELDEHFTWLNTEVKKEDYVSKRLPYALEEGDISAYDELIGVLYKPEERAKLEWAIGAVLTGDAKRIQKFIVLYGPGGTGKSTFLQILQWLVEGYYTTFEAAALTGNNNQFATEAFKANPLVAIQHDGDLSKIVDNSKLNSITAHEEMQMNEKYKASFMSRINAFLFMGTNKPVKITDAKSGIIRRLIDVHPTGEKLAPRKYQALMSQIQFELGAIAYHCIQVYRDMGKDYYSGYRPIEMMLQTDLFFNFIEAYYGEFKEQNGTTLNQAYAWFSEYVKESNLEYTMPKYKFRDELRNYFDRFDERASVDGVDVRSWYSGFNADHFKSKVQKDDKVFSLVMDEDESLLDARYANYPAQYSKDDGFPRLFWDDSPRMGPDGKEYIPKPSQIVTTVLSDLDTSQEHYINLPENEIVIDFDLKDANGEKSAERNLEAASQWPSTYAEFSKSGHGIHLHYDYVGDANELSRIYDDGIEIKVFTGNSSLRRRLSKCNNVPVAKLTGGLPLKEKKKMNVETLQSEKALRALIDRNLKKEIHAGTKPSMDFIHKILQEAYNSDLVYDVTDMRGKILAFANNSTNQAMYCIKLMQTMQFKSEMTVEESEAKKQTPNEKKAETLVFFDVEVFPNRFVICWKYDGADTVVRMVNPTLAQVEALFSLKLVGFNCRRYDNHIMYARMQG